MSDNIDDLVTKKRAEEFASLAGKLRDLKTTGTFISELHESHKTEQDELFKRISAHTISLVKEVLRLLKTP